MVDADLCASCGICAGACPSSTPFRSVAELVTGIDMPSAPINALRQRLRQGLAALPGKQPIVVFGCDHGAAVAPLAGARRGRRSAWSARGSCRRPSSSTRCATAPPACWSAAAAKAAASSASASAGPRSAWRVSASRTCAPPSRASALAMVWADAGEQHALQEALQRLRAACMICTPPFRSNRMPRMPDTTPRRALPASAWVGQVLLYALFALVIGVFSHWPAYQHLGADQALIKVSFTHAGKPVGDCQVHSEAELAKLPPNMRAPMMCPRERSPVTIEVDIDGVTALRRTRSAVGPVARRRLGGVPAPGRARRRAAHRRAPERRRAATRLHPPARGHGHAGTGAGAGDRLRRQPAAGSHCNEHALRCARCGPPRSRSDAADYSLPVAGDVQRALARGWLVARPGRADRLGPVLAAAGGRAHAGRQRLAARWPTSSASPWWCMSTCRCWSGSAPSPACCGA